MIYRRPYSAKALVFKFVVIVLILALLYVALEYWLISAPEPPLDSGFESPLTAEFIKTIEPQMVELITTENTTPLGELRPASPSTAPTTLSPNRQRFQDLMSKTSDFRGWLTIDGTNIDYPIVQGKDNNHYLNHDYLGNPTRQGAIYLDYRNHPDFHDNHISLYGHYMTNGTMFHNLHYYKDPDFFYENALITIDTPEGTFTYELFSAHRVSAFTYYLIMTLENEALEAYLQHLARVSMHKKDLDFPLNPKLLTLVTCTYEFANARLLLHGIRR
jgi:sortase B